MAFRKDLKGDYSPLYLLASLGSGGLAISFFMYLMFMVPHKGHPIPVFEDLVSALQTGGPLMLAIIALACLGILYFSFQHLRLLSWNIREYGKFKGCEQFSALKTSNAEVQLMAIPLTYGMAINVLFILGGVFVPSLWNYVEYLFPVSLAAFLAVGLYALQIFLTFFARVIAFGQFDCEKNNSLSQMLAIFALAMVAVGLAAPGAMSQNKYVSGLGIILAIGFVAIAMALALIKIVLGFRAMFEHGINKEAAISLWIVIPILTIIGITLFRISMGLHHNFAVHTEPWDHAILFTVIVMLQIFFAALGYKVMRHIGYCQEFISGSSKSVAAYAAICPGVAFFVMGNFLINRGLVSVGLVEKFSLIYWLLYLILLPVQLKTIQVLARLNNKLLKA